jgi:hypothetical protein
MLDKQLFSATLAVECWDSRHLLRSGQVAEHIMWDTNFPGICGIDMVEKRGWGASPFETIVVNTAQTRKQSPKCRVLTAGRKHSTIETRKGQGTISMSTYKMDRNKLGIRWGSRWFGNLICDDKLSVSSSLTVSSWSRFMKCKWKWSWSGIRHCRMQPSNSSSILRFDKYTKQVILSFC